MKLSQNIQYSFQILHIIYIQNIRFKNGGINMKTCDHYILAKEIAGTFKNFGGKLKKFVFIAGCIAPDINPFTYIKGHMFSDRHKFLEKVLKSGKVSAYNMGIMIHYIGDCFTFPHNSGFKGNLNEHLEYENRLHSFINSDFSRFAGKIKIPEKLSLSELFRTLHDEYTASAKTLENDCRYIYTVCVEIAGRLIGQPELQ